MAEASIRNLLKKSDMILMGACVLLAAGFLVLAGKSAAASGSFLTIDNLFFIAVCLLLALTFISIPAFTLRERGIHPFSVGDELSPARAAEHVHFEGGTRLFMNVLVGLLALTVIEVFLAYIQIHDLRIFLTILMGLSLVKAALIVAYFMHLKFERLSLVLTLVPTLVICICLLFIVFPDSTRTLKLRATRPAAQAPAQPSE
ncbi:MAG TPA: cytochrome C oxidase subunit IV family protein [Pyrinomonadaceae bacterium]|nr:cytochrome C oxidase subunit IV family protein [Pyrinomonadaceae bacterium]